MAGHGGGVPGDVKPGRAGQELVGVFTTAEERYQALELRRVPWADVGGAALKVLGVLDTAHEGVDTRIAEAGVDDDGTADGLAGGLQQLAATVGHVLHLLLGRDVVRVLL